MAHGTQCLMRLDSGNGAVRNMELISPEFHRYLTPLISAGKTFSLFKIKYAGTFSNGYAEISAPNAVFDGTTTPAVVYVDSSSAVDDAAGTGVQAVTIIGWDENDAFVKVAVATGGTTGQSSVTKFKRIFHAYASAWGANNDAEGDIYVQDDVTGTNKYLKIAAGSNESEGSALFFPTGCNFALVQVSLTMTSSGNANAAILVKYALTNAGGFGADPDLAYMEFRATIGIGGQMAQCTCTKLASAGAKVTFSETYKGAAEDGLAQMFVLAWY